jgi:L-threonylcarbamoyladenylate synthase
VSATEVTSDAARAVQVLRAGGLVAIPTETVYGLGADAENDTAVAAVFTAKRRPADHPLIVHLATADELSDGWASSVPPSAAILAERCWPGPLTMLLPRGRRSSLLVTGGHATVGLRVPAHPLALEVLSQFGGGVAAPSANRFGRVSPTSVDHVVEELDGAVDLVLDGGRCPVGVESTIVDCTVEPVQVLRPGAITADEIGELLGDVTDGSGPSRAPGMLASHYAPRCRVELFEDPIAAVERRDELRLVGQNVRVLNAAANLTKVARSLYASLRDADRDGVEVVLAILPPPAGLGHAIRDRLSKAAAPR